MNVKTKKTMFRTFSLILLPAAATAATLTMVPMQGGMVMPMFAYHAADGSLTVKLDPTVPQLTPLSISNPADNFDPADPWFDSLDPSRQGLAFSRRYGFVMDTMSDPLPSGTAIWIRKLSGSADLEAYRYRGNPKTWEAIFGTAGSTNVFPWDGTMFHPAFAAPPGTNAYTAEFEGFLVDTASGFPIAGASTEPFTLSWTDVPDGRPVLSISGHQEIIISWPAAMTNYVLEATENLPSPAWTQVTNSPALIGTNQTVLINGGTDQMWFRMRRVP